MAAAQVASKPLMQPYNYLATVTPHVMYFLYLAALRSIKYKYKKKSVCMWLYCTVFSV